MTLTNKTLASLPNELTLIDQAKSDPSAFSAIYDFYFARVYNYARYRILDRDLADDLTSEIFETVLKNLHTFRPDKGPFSAWLFTIARNTVNYSLRKRRIRQWLSLDHVLEQADHKPKPDETTIQNETQRELLQAISHLSERERELIALKFNVGLTNRAISKMTGLKENHVATILFRAIQSIRARMNPNGE